MVADHPALTGSKAPTSRHEEDLKRISRGPTASKSPIGSTNIQWGMEKPPH